MENRTFLQRYRLSLARNGLPVELHRAPGARTYRAQEIETGREVALTLVATAPGEPAVLERLRAEAIAAETINHINIPRLYDFGLENGELIYVSEYNEGHTASAWVGARGPLSIAAVLRVGLQVVDAMNATAFQRLYHSALNPDNILFVAGQTVEGDWPPIKVLHWVGWTPGFFPTGDARSESAARFAAPEQLSGGKADVRSEIYALGATMWFLLTGATSTAATSSAMKAELAKLRGVPKIVRHLLGRMLRRNPLERPQDPVALANYLQTCLVRLERRMKIERRFGIPVTTQPRLVERPARPPISFKPLALAAAVLILAAVALMFMPWSSGKRRAAPVAVQVSPLPSSLPNEVRVVTKESLGRIPGSEEDLPPASGPTVSETPRDELATTEPRNPAPPEEGPHERLVAKNPANLPVESPAPDEPAAEETLAPPVVATTNEPHPAADLPTAANVSAAAQVPESEATPSETPPKSKPKVSLAPNSSTRREVETVAEHPRTHVRKKTDHPVRTAKRARPLPKLRVGSAPAELVGTTRDGRWILSVAATGERVIVPPPPGYGP